MKKIKNILYGAVSVAMMIPSVALGVSVFDKTSGVDLPKDTTLMSIIVKIMEWLLMAVGVFGVIGFAIAGILYLTAAGNDDQIGKAKNAMLYSIIGVVVALAGLVALTFAKNLLSANEF